MILDILAIFWTLCMVVVLAQFDQEKKCSYGATSIGAVLAGTFIIWRIIT